MAVPFVARRSLVSAAAASVVLLPVSGAGGAREMKTHSAEAKNVGAVEDLMREHGVLRRCYLAYRESAGRLRINPGKVDAAALNDAAKLFRRFGEDYHERKLEEAHIFPRVKHLLPGAAASVDTLVDQHRRGREITDYILSLTGGAQIAAADAEPLARAFDSFEVMYANHAAREDTIVFPAWKGALSSAELADMGDLFEDIERAEFGGDGFENAVRQIADIEDKLGLTNLAQFTAPAPPGSRSR